MDIEQLATSATLLNSLSEESQKTFKTYPIWYFANKK